MDLLNIPGDLTGDGPSAATRLWLALMLAVRSDGRAQLAAGDALAARIARAAAMAEAAPTGPDLFGQAPPTIRQVLATVAAEERVDLPYLPDAIRDTSDPPPLPMGPVAATEPPTAPARAARPVEPVEQVETRLAAMTPKQMQGHARAAIDRAIATQRSQVGAAYRADVGLITIDWGVPGRGPEGKGGYGLSHVLAQRSAQDVGAVAFVRERLPEVLAKGRPANWRGPEDARRVDIVLDDDRAVLRLYRDGARETWLISAFPGKGGGPDETGGVNPKPPYAPTPLVSQAPEGAGPAAGIAPSALGDKAGDPELAILVDALGELAAAGRLEAGDLDTMRQGNQAGDKAAAMAQALEAGLACLVRGT